MSGTSEFDAAISERLADHDLRYTPGRRRVIAGLRSAGGPVTLPELLSLVPDLAQSSAYRNLARLEEVGVVRRLVHDADHARFELAESLTEHHHHLICDRCGRVFDVTFGDRLEAELDAAFDRAAAEAGFAVRDHRIDVHGRCAECAR